MSGSFSCHQKDSHLDQQVAAGSPLYQASRLHQPIVETTTSKQQLNVGHQVSCALALVWHFNCIECELPKATAPLFICRPGKLV